MQQPLTLQVLSEPGSDNDLDLLKLNHFIKYKQKLAEQPISFPFHIGVKSKGSGRQICPPCHMAIKGYFCQNPNPNTTQHNGWV